MKIKKSNFILGVILLFVLNVNYSLFYLDKQRLLIYILAIYSVLWFWVKRESINLTLKEGIYGYLIPYSIVTGISLVTAKLVYHLGVKPVITQSFVYFLVFLSAFLFAYYCVERYSLDCLKIAIISGTISYFTVIARWVYEAGIPGCFNFMNKRYNGVGLEVHNYTYCIGFFWVFILLSNEFTKKQKIRYAILLGVQIFLGNKRACYFAIIISMLVYFLFSKLRSRWNSVLRIIVFGYMIFSLGYVYIVKTGIFGMLVKFLGINDMLRVAMWNWINPYYEFSPLYFGKGIYFSDNLVVSKEFKSYFHMGSVGTQMHNDIVRAYIGWGFMPMLYYFYNFFYVRVKRYLNMGLIKYAWKYLALASYVFMIYFFDNMITAYNFNVCMFILFFLLFQEANKEAKNS